MKLLSSIFRKEIITLPRKKRFYIKRSVLVVLAGIVLMFGLLAGGSSRGTTVGLQIFASLSMSLLFAISMISAITASAMIMREKTERTLGLLFLSDISVWDFLIGKLFMAMFSITMATMSILPLFILSISLGGVSAQQILMSFAVIFTTAFFVSSAALFASSLANTENAMSRLLGFIFVGWYIILPVLGFNAPPRWYQELTAALSPFVAMGSLIEGKVSAFVILNCIVNIGLGIPFLVAARVVLPQRIFSKEKEPITESLKNWLKSMTGTRKWVQKEPLIGNPMAWKDYHFNFGGRRAIWLKVGISSFLLICIITYVVVTQHMTAKNFFDSVAYALFALSVIACGLGSISACGNAFQKDKNSRAMELLLTTPLSNHEIVDGKIAAILRSLLPWLTLMGITALPVMISCVTNDVPAGLIISMILETLASCFGYCALSLWISLRYKKNIAFPICILVFILYNTFGRGMMLGVMLGGEPAIMVFVDVIVHFIAGIVFMMFVYDSVRNIIASNPD